MKTEYTCPLLVNVGPLAVVVLGCKDVSPPDDTDMFRALVSVLDVD